MLRVLLYKRIYFVVVPLLLHTLTMLGLLLANILLLWVYNDMKEI